MLRGILNWAFVIWFGGGALGSGGLERGWGGVREGLGTGLGRGWGRVGERLNFYTSETLFENPVNAPELNRRKCHWQQDVMIPPATLFWALSLALRKLGAS